MKVIDMHLPGQCITISRDAWPGSSRCIMPCIPASARCMEKKAAGVTKHLRRQPRLHRFGKSDSTDLATKVFEFSREGIMITDNQMNIISVNHAFTEITGYSEEDVVGKKSCFLYACQENVIHAIKMSEKILQEGYWQGEIWGRRKNGEVYPEWLTVSTAADETGKAALYINLFSDITEKKREQSRFEYLAYHDSLTGLPNRILFNERLSAAIALAQRHSHPLAVLFLDLDGFKQINDTLGHSIGDMLLQQVAQRLARCIRESDAVARLGGDEFVILLNELSSEHSAEDVTRKIMRLLQLPFILSGQKIRVGLSIGIALFPDHGTDGEALLEKADAAMYQAKIRRRNNSRSRTNFQVFSSPQIDVKSEI